jgi:hypothetical protein
MLAEAGDVKAGGRLNNDKRSFGGFGLARLESLTCRTLRGTLSPNRTPWPELILEGF